MTEPALRPSEALISGPVPMRRFRNLVKIAGVGFTPLNPQPPQSAQQLMVNALQLALEHAQLAVGDLNGLVAIPSLAAPNHFMQAHALATEIQLLPNKNVTVKTLDTGGAGPVTGLLEARRMIQVEGCHAVAVVAGDAVSSLSREDFLSRADATCQNPHHSLASPVIPHSYDRIAQWQIERYGLKREQLAMCSSLMSLQASRHPWALTRKARTVGQVLASEPIAPVTTKLECARRADGGAAVIVASAEFMQKKGLSQDAGVVIVSGGEASGPLWVPKCISESMFSCEEAAAAAYEEAQLGPRDIDFFGLYDCFPICLIRAIEAVGLAEKGKGGDYIESKYHELIGDHGQNIGGFPEPQDVFPINLHGGLLCCGAPWEAPAMYNIIEAFAQLKGLAKGRQIRHARRALVYGNGGVFSSSAVAILGSGQY